MVLWVSGASDFISSSLAFRMILPWNHWLADGWTDSRSKRQKPVLVRWVALGTSTFAAAAAARWWMAWQYKMRSEQNQRPSTGKLDRETTPSKSSSSSSPAPRRSGGWLADPFVPQQTHRNIWLLFSTSSLFHSILKPPLVLLLLLLVLLWAFHFETDGDATRMSFWMESVWNRQKRGSRRTQTEQWQWRRVVLEY